MKLRLFALLAGGVISMAAMLVFAGPVAAHHSMSMYDRSHDTSFKATITEFNWSNPHTQIIFTVTDEHGNSQKWVAEGPGPNRLANRGWSKESLKPGDEVTIVGNCNKDGSPTMRFEKVILANGQELDGRGRYY
jgi:hypothetical protein